MPPGPRQSENEPRYDFTARTVQAWAVRGLAGLVIAGALALLWLTTWQAERQEPEFLQHRPELVLLPGGSFEMGILEHESPRDSNVMLLHEAEVAPFYVCRTEVTVAQWRAVMGTKPSDCKYGCEDEHPVQNVSWNDACAFMSKLTELENEVRAESDEPALTQCYEASGATWTWRDKGCTGFRLPTETEWEYAARAGTETAYSFGDETKEICAYGNVMDKSGTTHRVGDNEPASCDDGHENLAKVGSYKPNKWGLYDVHGNVWEWVWDWYKRETPAEASARGYAGPVKGELRVLRGGSFRNGPVDARSVNRNWYWPRLTISIYGFRCVRGAPQLEPLSP